METEEILKFLVAERDRLERAIQALQGPSKPRGRPPKTEGNSQTGAPLQKRKSRSAAQRRAQSEKMKKYWAARRKQQKSQD